LFNKRKLHSAEIVRRVGPRQWLWWSNLCDSEDGVKEKKIM